MPARKGDRPFLGMTNPERKMRTENRRRALLEYLKSDPQNTPSRDELAAHFNVSLRSIKYDLKYLFEKGLWRERGSRFTDPFNDQGADYKRYQIIDLIRGHQATGIKKLYEIYTSNYFQPLSYTEFHSIIQQLALQNRIMPKITSDGLSYTIRTIPLQQLECVWLYPPPYRAACKTKKQTIKEDQHSHSNWGRVPYKCVKLSNTTRCKFIKERAIYIETSKSCVCGGPLTINYDGVTFCKVCGLVDAEKYTPGLENIPSEIIGRRYSKQIGGTGSMSLKFREGVGVCAFDNY